MNNKLVEKIEKCLKYADKDLETCTVKISDLKYLLEEYKKQDADLYEANNRINELLDIVKLKEEQIEYIENEYGRTIEQKDKIIDEILKSWKQDDVRSIEELKKYFEERCK